MLIQKKIALSFQFSFQFNGSKKIVLYIYTCPRKLKLTVHVPNLPEHAATWRLT